ncbi:MAG: N-acetyltransferase [Chloroflexi bacterium]|nr:N-acetyltransferase [Chloroflexota bacterium]
MEQLITPQATLIIQPACPTQVLETLSIDAGLGFFWHNRPDVQLAALKKIAALPGGNVTVARNDRAIVGYVTLGLPDPDVRWGRDHIPGLYELGGIEVSRTWRRRRVAEAILRATFAGDAYADAIVIATGYRWCWDFEESGVSVREYREGLHRLFQKFGFEFFDTDEPNIAWYPDNALVARVGARAAPELLARFKTLLFENSHAGFIAREFVSR